MNRFAFSLIAMCCASSFMNAQQPASPDKKPSKAVRCDSILAMRMNFLLDGSFQSEAVPAQELKKMVGCGIDDFDVLFFGDMNALSTMLTKMTKSKKIEALTYDDLLVEIEKVRETDFYKNMRDIHEYSKLLSTRVATYKNWPEDEKLFDALGSSENIKNKVVRYLREHPDNVKTYKEILESLKK